MGGLVRLWRLAAWLAHQQDAPNVRRFDQVDIVVGFVGFHDGWEVKHGHGVSDAVECQVPFATVVCSASMGHVNLKSTVMAAIGKLGHVRCRSPRSLAA